MNFILMFLASILISALPLLGLAFISLKADRLSKFINSLVSLSAGTLLGGAFIHLLPESLENLSSSLALNLTLASFLGFLLIEKFLHWQHCHHQDCSRHSFGYMNLIGDGLHNFLDGLILASAFSLDLRLGLVTSLGIILHEIPQEVGDFAVLLKAGFSRKQALRLNLLIAATAILGTLTGYILGQRVEMLAGAILPVAAGGFIYIAATDLLPQLRDKRHKQQLNYLGFLFLGIIMMIGLKKIL